MNRLISLYFLTFVLFSCKKSIQEKRIEGTWKVINYSVNNIDLTNTVTYPNILGYRFEYTEDKDTETPFQNIYEVDSNNGEIIFGHWGERKGKMFLGVEYKTVNTGPFFENHYYKFFNILELKKNYMTYSLQDGNKFHRIHFKKIRE